MLVNEAKSMKLIALLIVVLGSCAHGARLRARSLVVATRQNETHNDNKLPYVLDRCTEVQEVFGKAKYMGKKPMSLDVCFTFCGSRKSFYFGVRNGQECWCGSQYQARIGTSTLCNVPCQGNEKAMCGGADATSVYIMGSGPCDDGPATPGESSDKNLAEADQALAKVVEQAEKVVEKKNKKFEIKGAKRIAQAKRLVARAKEDISGGDQTAAKQKLKKATVKVKVATRQFDKMKSHGDTPTPREQQAEKDLKVVKKALKEVVENPSPDAVKKADKLLDQAAALPPPKRPSVCLNFNGALKSFEFTNLHDNFLRHQGFRLKASVKADDDLFKNDATFEIMPPLLASANCGISIRSKNFPENYVRHRGFELHLDKQESSDIFKNDATFFAIAPKDSSLTGAYLLRSTNFPDRYIHVRANGEAYLDQLAAGKEKEFAFKIVAPLMSILGARTIITRNYGDWGTVNCDRDSTEGTQIIGGGCDARKSPYKMQYNGPDGDKKWKCGGHGSQKKIWAICARGLKRQIVQKSGGDWTTAVCPPGQKVISGGCNANNRPFIMQYSGPDGANQWKCGGHGGPKTVWAICSAEADIVVKEKKGGDWTTVECDAGKKVIGGGCNAHQSPHIFQYNGPTTSGTAWKCGGHGGPKQVWAICEQ